MTGSQWITYVLVKCKRPDKTSEILDATTDIIADMRMQFYSEDYKEEAYLAGISTLGEYRLPLPVDFGHLIGDVSITDQDTQTAYPPLIKLSKEKYDEIYTRRSLDSDNQYQSIPLHYCIFARQIYLGPVPNKITYRYQINYTTEAGQVITSSSTSVPFSDQVPHRNVLRAGVLKDIHEGMENFQEAQYWEGEYNKGLSKIIASETVDVQDDGNVEYCDF